MILGGQSHTKQKQIGITLVEVMLVLVIGMSLIVFSIRQYQAWQRDTDLDRLSYNVDQLFQAMSGFYYANCGLTGRLSPTTSSPVLVNMTNDLITPKFMDALPPNPFVTATTGYVLQFNQYTQDRNIDITCGTNCSTPRKIGTIVRWSAQVSVLVNDTANVAAYQQRLQATCLSSLNGSTVYPCSANRTGNYLVWERIASLPTGRYDVNSTFWPVMPLVQQFNQMYTTSPILNLTGTSGANQYFYCGS